MLQFAMNFLAAKLARRLKDLRGTKTQRQFAKELGISQTALNHIEQGRENVTLKTLEKITRRLKCKVGWLFEEE